MRKTNYWQKKDDILPNNTLTVGIELDVYDDYQTFPTEFMLETPQRKITDDLKELYKSKRSYSSMKEHKIIFEWKIDQFNSFIDSSLTCTDDVKVESVGFSTGAKINDAWYLRLKFKNNEETQVKEWLSVFLYLKHSDTESLLENKDSLLPNNIMTLCVDLIVLEDYTSTTMKVPLKILKPQIVDDFEKLFNKKINVDVILIVGNEKFHAHKTILSARSPVLASVLHRMQESNNNILMISDVAPEIFREMLRFIYTDKVDDLDSKAVSLLQVADRFKLQTLKISCEESLRKSLINANAIKLLMLADQCHANLLMESVVNYIVINIDSVMKTEDYKTLENSKPLMF
ncbi:speckle-type POZ protein-like [Microplitis demolitor]|uniref:speckle-type POZ protein-like n=1 Tax=Microplitis demolitor TaxID=69319 RepID=UPI00235B6123|nr:speckle-type POZ protein-like [Microplitis demolitor]